MSKSFQIGKNELTLDHLKQVLDENNTIELSDSATHKIQSCRDYLDKKMEDPDHVFYGINTGFGALADVRVESENLSDLQKNLVMSHACGIGDEVPLEIVRLMLFLKIQSLSYGHSGAALSTVERLMDMYNNKVYPEVFQLGSLGASGDLAPLAHLCLPILGLGKVYHDNVKKDTELANAILGWEPLELQSKEGLALLNGTQFMSAYASWALIESKRLYKLADHITALSLDAFDGKKEPFLPYIHSIRPHKGQVETAKNILNILTDSNISKQPKKQVQDPYCFRCVPQVHGATKDTIDHASAVLLKEVNSVTDNPNVFPEEDLILSGGNFHGQPLALILDFMAIAMAELGNISERRTYKLISGQRGLPAFLSPNPGLNSGFMIPQYTAASMVSQNKQFCTPASVDSIESSNGQEDHVSMGANAATKLYKVVKNVERILAIEWLTACQALEFRRPDTSSALLEEKIKDYRKIVPSYKEDRVIHDDFEPTIQFLKDNF